MFIRKLYFYDAIDPVAGADPNVEKYWEKIERLPDTEVRFGTLRGNKPQKRRQKCVDIQLAVDMLVGCFNKLFDVAVLISGDEDFVPVVYEVQRRGVSVVVAGVSASTSAELRRIADRYVDLTDPEWWTKNPISISGTPPPSAGNP